MSAIFAFNLLHIGSFFPKDSIVFSGPSGKTSNLKPLYIVNATRKEVIILPGRYVAKKWTFH